MTYYKGYLLDEYSINTYRYTKKLGKTENSFVNDDSDIIIYTFTNISGNNYFKLRKIIRKFISINENNIKEKKYLKIEDNEIIKYLNNLYKELNKDVVTHINNVSNIYGDVTQIVYELLKDKDGNLFGKELYTGKLFPIYNSKCEKYDYQIIINYNDNKYFFELEIIPTIEVSSLFKCNCFIVGHQVADLNDFNKYINMFRGRRLFKKHENKEIEKYKNNIIKYSQSNVFKEDNIEKKEIVKVKQSIETTLMEDVEYFLMNLKNINKDLYLEYKDKYDNLLSKEINREELALFLGEIEFISLFKKRNIEGILEYINNLKEEYLNNFINKNNIKTDIDLKKIDKITELFLRIKDRFSLLNQREVLKNLAFLYLMEVYENIDIITIEELNDSYFNYNRKYYV